MSPLKIVDLSMDTGEVYLKWLELQDSEDFILVCYLKDNSGNLLTSEECEEKILVCKKCSLYSAVFYSTKTTVQACLISIQRNINRLR